MYYTRANARTHLRLFKLIRDEFVISDRNIVCSPRPEQRADSARRADGTDARVETYSAWLVTSPLFSC